jgi:hypothetical protein
MNNYSKWKDKTVYHILNIFILEDCLRSDI